MTNTIPSRFQPREVVIFHLGPASFEAYVESVRFGDEGDLYYTLDVYYEGGDSLHVRLPDIPAAFIERKTDDWAFGLAWVRDYDRHPENDGAFHCRVMVENEPRLLKGVIEFEGGNWKTGIGERVIEWLNEPAKETA